MSGIDGFPGFLRDFTRGTTKDFTIRITKDGAAVDITGAKFIVAFVEELKEEQTPALRKEITSLTDPGNGETTGEITDTESLALTAGKWYYTVRYITSAGKTYVIDKGKIKLYEALIEDVEQ